MKLEELLSVLKQTDIPVFHYNTKTFPKMPYIAYTEYAEKYIKADNKITETVINIQVDLFTTKTDKIAKKVVKNALNENGCNFSYTCIAKIDEKNSDENYLHHIFDCEVYE